MDFLHRHTSQHHSHHLHPEQTTEVHLAALSESAESIEAWLSVTWRLVNNVRSVEQAQMLVIGAVYSQGHMLAAFMSGDGAKEKLASQVQDAVDEELGSIGIVIEAIAVVRMSI